MFFGNSPPHQATIFSRNLLIKFKKFDEKFFLSADLNYFLKLLKKEDLYCFNSIQNIVCMGDEGISARSFRKRIVGVAKIYKSSFGHFWFIPFLSRYVKKVLLKYSKIY